jgi:hypothetical protein
MPPKQSLAGRWGAQRRRYLLRAPKEPSALQNNVVTNVVLFVNGI